MPFTSLSGRRGAGAVAGALLFIGVLVTTACPPKKPKTEVDTRPVCDDCRRVNATVLECHHWANDPNGAPCSTTECIENVLDTDSCQRYPGRTGAADCDTRVVPGGSVVQRIRAAACPGGRVAWTPWRTVYTGCGTDCDPQAFRIACRTEACDGPVVRGPFNRGRLGRCGC